MFVYYTLVNEYSRTVQTRAGVLDQDSIIMDDHEMVYT